MGQFLIKKAILTIENWYPIQSLPSISRQIWKLIKANECVSSHIRAESAPDVLPNGEMMT